MAWTGGNGRSRWVGVGSGQTAAHICRSSLGRRWRASRPRVAQAARAFLAVSVTSSEAACAHFTSPPPRAGSARNCDASGIFSHLPLATTPAALPASQKISRLDPGGVPARSHEVLRRRRHHPNLWPPWQLRGDSGTALRANRSVATRLQAVPTAGSSSGHTAPLCPHCQPPPCPHCRTPSPPRRDNIITQQGLRESLGKGNVNGGTENAGGARADAESVPGVRSRDPRSGWKAAPSTTRSDDSLT